MQGLRAWWDSLTPDSRALIIEIGGGVGAAAIVTLVVIFRDSLTGLGRRLISRQPRPSPVTPAQPTPPPPQPVVIEVRTPPAPPQETKPTEPTPPVPLPQIPRAPMTGFVPRRDTEGNLILDRLIEELAPEKQQLLALCGAGGVGKTTLAAAAVRALSDAFARRVAWVSADGRPDFSLSTMLDGIAVQLGHEGLRPLPLEQKDERLCALLAESPTLVVLDNFETVADTEKDSCADWLANRAPCCGVITARDAVPHARPVNIHAMSPPEARKFVGLLIKQARHPRSFEGFEHDRIVEEAERNPLLLQWIVRQIDLAREPGAVLSELARGGGDAAERVFGRSFGLLSDDARAALLALSLFVPDASREALAEVTGFGADAARLDKAAAQLAELWLANATQGNARLSVAGLTREMSKHRLDADARATEFRRRFVAYFVRYAETHRQQTPEDFDALEAERENLLAAMDTAFKGQQWRDVTASYVALWWFLYVRGYWDESIRRGQQAIEAAQAMKDKGFVAVSAAGVATIRQSRGEYSGAEEAYCQAIQAFRELGDDKNVAVGLHQLGMNAQLQGEVEEAGRLYQESLEIKRRLDDQSGIAATLHELGILAQDAGDDAEARLLYQESLEIGRRLGNQRSIASSLHNLAALAQDTGDTDGARELYNESLEIERRLGNQRGIASSLHHLAMLAQDAGDAAEARLLYQESLEIKRRLGDQNGIAVTLHNLGALAAEQGDKMEAGRLYREALTIFEKLGSPDAAGARRNLEMLEGGES